MSSPSPLTILVVSEDVSDLPVREIVRKTLSLIEPQLRTKTVENGKERELIRLLPLREGSLRGSVWKSTKGSDYAWQLELIRTIATELCRPNTFVCFHVDGDRPWSKAAESENVAKFRDRVITKVSQQISMTSCGHDPLDRLFLVAPFYSIEAWLYQNIDEAVRLCGLHHRGEHLAQWEAWRGDRASLDELEEIKKLGCLANELNFELAKNGLQLDNVFALYKSYCAFVQALLASKPLTEALQRTRAT